jgi:hypothetical protein
LRKYDNLYRLLFATDGLWACFRDWPAVEQILLARLSGEAFATQNEDMHALHKEMLALRRSPDPVDIHTPAHLPLLSFTLQKGARRASLFSMLTTFGTPLDVTTQELRIETFFPADEETRQLFCQPDEPSADDL